MGCLNDERDFPHWFGNIHFSGPCNRACYFCIGQHMMELDALNNLDVFPLKGYAQFVSECQERAITEVNLTGSNTDPSLYRHLHALLADLRINGFTKVGIRTNGIRTPNLSLFDQVSISVTSLDPTLYGLTMSGTPPDLSRIRDVFDGDLSANVVLCLETVSGGDVLRTIHGIREAGFGRINLREPYGQPYIGDPLAGLFPQIGVAHSNPIYDVGGIRVTYWNVHYTEVKSVNLYASGRISRDYSVTKGHGDSGQVLDQSHFRQGRNVEQWRTPPAPEGGR